MSLSRLLLAAMVPLLLFGWSANFVTDSMDGTGRIPEGSRKFEVRLLLRVQNVRADVDVTASCKWGVEATEARARPTVTIDGLGGPQPNEGIVDFEVPVGEEVSIPFVVRCERPSSGREDEVYWRTDVRAEARGGCTPAACIGPESAVSLTLVEE